MNTLDHDGTPWRWLAGIFAAPLDPEAIAACRAGIASSEMAAEDSMLSPGLRQMGHALDALPAGAEGVAALARAYTLLFSGAGGPQTVPPYESAFTTPNGRLFGEPEARMRALLAELNLHVAKELGEAADHVAVEFAVMAELPAGSARRDDLARHLDRWLNDFRAGCAARDGTGFYAGAAMVATALARQELAGRAVDVDA